MRDTMDKHCLQNPLDVVEGVTHACQAATHEHTLSDLLLINTSPHYSPLYLALTQCQHSMWDNCLSCLVGFVQSLGLCDAI